MIDHLLPLIYRDYEYFDEANKENYGYTIRRRARPISSRVSTPSRTPPRPPRRTRSNLQAHGGVASNRKPKRRRESLDDDHEDEREAKKQQTHSTARDDKQASTKKQEETLPTEKDPVEAQEPIELVTLAKKTQEPTISAKKVAKKVSKKMTKKAAKTSKKSKKTKVTAECKQKKTVKASKSVTPKRIPLQDITHLYVNEHIRSYPCQQRERFVAGLSTSVAIRFF